MPISVSAAAVCLIVCHGGPADHFATFAEKLSQNERGPIDIYASGPALKKFQERGIMVKVPFSVDRISPQEEDALAEEIAKACSTAAVVITDVGHGFDLKVQKALARQAAHVTRFAYYDNPESYVPGGYSETAAKVMKAAHGVLFANSNLTQLPIFQSEGKKIDLGDRKKIGIGYYPVHQAEEISKRRSTEKSFLRGELFEKNQVVDEGQKVLAYFGGNNKEYFSKALPAFLSLLEKGMKKSDFSHFVILFQQHPGAKASNIDKDLVEKWIKKHEKTSQAPKIILSDSSSEHVQTVADGILYYQTSMGPQFALAGIPTVQIGHRTYEDVLVKNKLSPSVTKPGQLIDVLGRLNEPKQEISKPLILESLGTKADWMQVLETAICP